VEVVVVRLSLVAQMEVLLDILAVLVVPEVQHLYQAHLYPMLVAVVVQVGMRMLLAHKVLEVWEVGVEEVLTKLLQQVVLEAAPE
jgi:hypothetical protein